MSSAPAIKLARKVPAAAEVHGLPLTTEQVATEDGSLPWKQITAQGFTGKLGESAMVTVDGLVRCLVGMGSGDDVDADVWRRIGAVFARASKRCQAVSLAVTGVTDMETLAEGIALGSYDYTEFKSEPVKPSLKTVSLIGTTSKKSEAAVVKGLVIADAVNQARDFVNEPGGTLTPERFANEAKRIARQPGLTIRVLGLAEIKKAKLGGVLGVNRGSDLPPRLVEMNYKCGVRGAPTIALVGKGITFDAGGLSIKSSAGMSTMKCDMGGGAAVLGAMSALPALKPAVNVKAWVPMTDNMLGGDATRLGDVLTIRNGKTVEILNSDAEGRLILADGLSLASEAKPDAVIDLATLTGAAMVSLGTDYSALMANNDDFAAQVEAAADDAGELTWRMPLPARYLKLLDSPIADMKNIGGPYGGAITAALFLQEFVAEGLPWAHLDIAGPAFADSVQETGPKGGTGYGVRTLISLITNFTKPQA
ncbi:MAG: leucyl aminopeptidase [Acidimicrobiales bacterium]|jgi:leucyl aminopeptidase